MSSMEELVAALNISEERATEICGLVQSTFLQKLFSTPDGFINVISGDNGEYKAAEMISADIISTLDNPEELVFFGMVALPILETLCNKIKDVMDRVDIAVGGIFSNLEGKKSQNVSIVIVGPDGAAQFTSKGGNGFGDGWPTMKASVIE